MKTIELSEDTYNELAMLAEPFESPESVIIRLIKDRGTARSKETSQSLKTEGRLFTNREIQERISRIAVGLTPSKLAELCNSDHSKEVFGINFPLLVRIPAGASHQQKRDLVKSSDGVNRWTWKFGFVSEGYEYAICTQWYDYNDRKVKYWLSRYERNG
ncbi:hypothetical protein HYO47_22830 [Vibrio parahaemolyticus]|uniref:hypothetical protein n=1 Tax=Vibrio harveyi group TaxID=717610 RepID=UPI00193ECCBC|nr:MULTISPECIES: hypothetical protein [Vibrio harveyi group]MBM4855680.1 hypothetical protein [Vibrio parahaemolyticus]MBS9995349.1 hypothetical protein [Vibrio alginolyticus]WMN97253.1 hypothetical protein NI380_06405 [Vibrio parahaemolyticus]HAS6112016.1 hypothetical protein [Vibrio vulnificus]